MNLATPIAHVIPGALGIVLDQLAMSETEYTRSGLAKRVAGKVGKSRVYELLEELTESGLVLERQLEGPKLYSLNRSHLLAGPVLQLAKTRETLINRLGNSFSEWSPKPIASYIFGSVARGSSSSKSDIDILLIRPDEILQGEDNWLRQRFDIEIAIEQWTGNSAHILDYSESEWKTLVAAKQALTLEVFSDAVTLFGPSIGELNDHA